MGEPGTRGHAWRTFRYLEGNWWRNAHNQIFFVITVLPFGLWVKWAKNYPQVEGGYTFLSLEHMQEFYPEDKPPYD